MISFVPKKPSWLNLPLAVVLGLSTIGLVIDNVYFVVDHFSWTLDRLMGVPFFERTIRAPVKAFFDTHFFITILTFFCYPIFGVSLSIVGIQWFLWSRESDPTRHRILRWVVYAICMAPPGLVAWVIGGVSVNLVLWLAPLVLAGAAFLGEQQLPPRHLAWLRPFLWGAFLGTIAELAR